MALTVRGLLPKVQVFRKDLEEERSIYAIQEAVRKVCRQTMLARELVYNMSAMSELLTMPTSLLYAYNRVHKVEILDFDGNWKVLNEYNQVHVDNVYSYPDLPAGIPAGYTYLGNGVIHLYPRPNQVPSERVVVGRSYTIATAGTIDWVAAGAASNTAGIRFTATSIPVSSVTPEVHGTVYQEVRAEVSYIPTGEITDIPLPDECEDCVVAGALAFIMMQPGTGQNMNFGKDREVLHNRELGNLKAIALFGQSGRLRATGRVLGGRQKS
ncbi:MAG: hypothetical protein WCO52_06630, partial [bacterium]